jgi:5-methylcytosine-specific restriction endonuclease McrA
MEDGINIDYIKKDCIANKTCTLKIVRYKYPNGGVHVIRQCNDCGKVIFKAIAKSKFINVQDIPLYNHEKLAEFEKLVSERESAATGRMALMMKVLKLHKQNRDQAYEQLFGEKCTDFQTAYSKYINSEAWQKRRSVILNRDNFKCRICQTADATDVHHISYRNLCSESDLELISVCRECHELIHDRSFNLEKFDMMSPNFVKESEEHN